jgi:tetratricopeptide (TPR) repeat protein
MARDHARGNAGQRALVATLQSALALTRGRVDEAERLLRDAMVADLETGDAERYHVRTMALAELYLLARGDTAGALAILDDLLATHPLRSMEPLDRSYFGLASLFATAGRLDRARRALAEQEREVAPILPVTVPHRVRAALAEADGRLEDAVMEWRLEDEAEENPLPALAHLGSLYDRLGQPDSAIAYFRRYLTTPFRIRYDTDPIWRGHALERLARLHDDRGETREAARHYAMLVELWSDADPPLQARVEYAQQRIGALTAVR